MTRPLIDEVLIRCDPATAFDLLADVRNETRWSTSVSSATLHGDGPIRAGSKFSTVYRGMENDVSIVELDRPERLVVASANERMEIEMAYTFADADGGTRLVVSTDVRPKGFISVLSPLLRLFMRRELAKKFAIVKQACENTSESSRS